MTAPDPDHPPAVTDALLRDILTRVRSIALVGLSANPDRPSHAVAAYLARQGYRIIGVNPGLAGQVMFGETVRASLADIPTDIDMVDIFREPAAVPAIVEAALARCPALTAIWMQIGVRHAEAAARARAAGVLVVEDRCPKIDHQRLFGA
jgi:predicted CoA-binding protein